MKVISVGGSIIIPKTGFDISFLKKFRQLILSEVKKGQKFILVIGGGATCRVYQQALARVVKTSPDDLDWMGIHTTIFNAQFVRLMFKDFSHAEVITNPHRKVKTTRPIIVAAGEKPGASSDIDAVELAIAYGVDDVINLSNIEYVYTKDPNVYKDAERIERIEWPAFRRDVVGAAWKPGSNVPFDPTASARAESKGLTVSILKGTDLIEVKKAVQGKKFKGTLVLPLGKK